MQRLHHFHGAPPETTLLSCKADRAAGWQCAVQGAVGCQECLGGTFGFAGSIMWLADGGCVSAGWVGTMLCLLPCVQLEHGSPGMGSQAGSGAASGNHNQLQLIKSLGNPIHRKEKQSAMLQKKVINSQPSSKQLMSRTIPDLSGVLSSASWCSWFPAQGLMCGRRGLPAPEP